MSRSKKAKKCVFRSKKAKKNTEKPLKKMKILATDLFQASLHMGCFTHRLFAYNCYVRPFAKWDVDA